MNASMRDTAAHWAPSGMGERDAALWPGALVLRFVLLVWHGVHPSPLIDWIRGSLRART